MARYLAVVLVVSLITDAFSVPSIGLRRRRIPEDNVVYSYESAVIPVSESSEVSAQSISTPSTTTVSISPNKQDEDDDDDDDFDTPSTSTGGGGGGSNLFSLLNLATSLMPTSGSTSSGGNTVKNNNVIVKKIIKELIRMNRNQIKLVQRRKDVADNVIELDYTDVKPPPVQKLELDDDESGDSDSEGSDEDNGGEESVEKESNENGGSKQDSTSDGDAADDDDDDDDNDSDYDEPPEGDGQGGGILGLLAGLSGDGDSDLGTLLATVGGIVANLSGDGIDVNALIATGLGLFVGLLSEGNENPGEIIGNYLLTSLDTITGGGAQNNGAFFGKFLSTLIKGTSAAGDPDASGSSEENGPKMADSAGFFASLLMGLLGEMSKTSSGSNWR